MDGPEDAAAPTEWEAGQGEAKNQLAGCDSILGNGPAERERRHRLALDEQRRRASRALDRMVEAPQGTAHRMSERWEREFCNQLAADGWDPEYLARRYGLTMRGVRA